MRCEHEFRQVVAASLGCAAFAELVSWLFVYRTQRYKSLNQELQRLSKRLEARKTASRSANNKKVRRSSRERLIVCSSSSSQFSARTEAHTRRARKKNALSSGMPFVYRSIGLMSL